MTREERELAVDWFCERIKEKMREPQNESKPCFTGFTPHELLANLITEVGELTGELNIGEYGSYVIGEAADVAAYAMMIAHNANVK